MCPNNGLTDSEPEPVAGHLRVIGRVDAEERLEDAFAIVNRDTWPLVIDGELQFAVVGDASGDADWGMWRRVFDRVLDEISEHALDTVGIHPERREGRRHVEPQRALSNFE
jgi:hypothetical protein